MDAPLLDVDDESTWPPDLRRLLDASRDLLSRAEAQRVHPKELSWEELAEDHALLVSRVQGLIDDATVVAHHCTRLHRDEIQDIQRDGLLALNRADATERVRRRVESGDLPPDLGARLLASTTFGDRRGQRTGRVWLILTRGALRKESGVWRLFTFWGGEAVYWEHIDDPASAARLQSIGTATIVRAPSRWTC